MKKTPVVGWMDGRGLLRRDSGARVLEPQRYDESALGYAIRKEVAVRARVQ
ncbi:hypothetical protein ACEN8I_19895 [Polaromonas sp. CT11-55]|uniref:hypothetical protein n=1 Tax=Polaromonas sp. CT11-55 TaxID=3243045 RepID=UPI0039A478AF